MTCCTCSHSEISRILLLCSSSRNKGKTLTVLKKAGLCPYTTKNFKGRQIHIAVGSFHFRKILMVGKVGGKSISMQSSALAFASICGGDLTSMIYSKYYISLTYWNTVYQLGLFQWWTDDFAKNKDRLVWHCSVRHWVITIVFKMSLTLVILYSLGSQLQWSNDL